MSQFAPEKISLIDPLTYVTPARDVIVIPTYNEKDNVSRLIPKIFAIIPYISIHIVDDNSPDGTATEVERLMQLYPNLSLTVRKQKDGLGAAYKHILGILKFDPTIRTIITMDADGSHDPYSLEHILVELENADMVVGSRYVPMGRVDNWPFHRKLLSRGANIYARMITGLPVHDLTAGFVGFHKRVLDALDLSTISSTGYAYQIDFKHACIQNGAKILEIPIIFREREIGHSKITFPIIFEGMLTPLRLFFKKLFT